MSQFNETLYENHPEIQIDKQTYPKKTIQSTAAVQFEDGNIINKIVLKNPEERIAKTITVFMKVQACYPEFTLDKTMLNFWECKVHERKKITVRITNKHADLPLDFSFNKISFFTTDPISGMVAPFDDVNVKNGTNCIDVDISFHPESFGNTSDVILFKYINNMYSFPIRVLGSCKQIGNDQVIINLLFININS